ncbi:MAG: 3-oxoacyl-ACP reductase FabG [Bifidobacteriaceae bacterium]|jgi:3-oxoacyl-[acyl-carrier protein] reductase|nr:3-oxoacyl-ACP reductase FabG [Bifidobacteriaceae bacterium]
MSQPRSVLITGASRGIGQAIADLLVADGHRVATFDRTGAERPGILALRGDVADAEAVDAGFAAAGEVHGPVEVLVANAGITRDGLVGRMSVADFDAVVDVNLRGAFHCVRRAVPAMVRARWGRIVFTGSVVGLGGSEGQVNYASAKAGLVGMARSLAREVGPRHITANVVAPGFIETEMTAALPERRRDAYREAIPARRFGQADEVAHAVAFLIGDRAAYINGAVLPVDGGLGMGH